MIKRTLAVVGVTAVAGTLTVAAAAVAATGHVASGARGPAPSRPEGRSCRAGGYEPELKPAEFGRTVHNPYFPLPVGRTLIYRGIKDGETQVDRVHVTRRRRVIEGISSVAVTDVASHRSALLEKTTDWYAQDKRGNVWYMGERTAAYLPHGKVDHSGSWLAGVNDAEPGIVMQAHPEVPRSYRQECLPGQAEDMAWTVVSGGRFTAGSATFTNVLTSLEFTRLEPGVIDKKVYAPGVGIVEERAMSGPKETAVLVSSHG
jgi:hypothetical protein